MKLFLLEKQLLFEQPRSLDYVYSPQRLVSTGKNIVFTFLIETLLFPSISFSELIITITIVTRTSKPWQQCLIKVTCKQLLSYYNYGHLRSLLLLDLQP